MTTRIRRVLEIWASLLALSSRQAAARGTCLTAHLAPGPAASRRLHRRHRSDVKTGDLQPATSPAASQPVNPKVNAILDDTEKAGKEFHTIKADVEFVEYQTTFEEKKTFPGAIYFDKPAPEADARFRIHFDSIRNNAGDRVRADRDVSFFPDRDGRWLITRDGDITQ